MKLEQQITNLELSKKLEELGVKQESLFYWGERPYGKNRKPWVPEIFGEDAPFGEGVAKIASAFTVAELGTLLPKSIQIREEVFWLQIEPQGVQDGWACQYRNIATKFGFVPKFFEDKSMTNAMAKMLIYLIENKLLK